MYVVRSKQTGEILHQEPSVPGERTRKAQDVFPDFDPRTMEFGRSDQPSIPAWFTIERGKVREAEPPPEAVPAAEDEADVEVPELPLDQAKALLLEHYSAMSMDLRAQLIPDYKMQNAALGVYDDERTAAIRDTVAAFRDEYHRLEEAVQKAGSLKELARLRPRFPKAEVKPKRK